MAFRFTIGRKIGTGFAALILLTIVSFVITYITSTNSKQRTNIVVKEIAPSVSLLKELSYQVERSQKLITKWNYFQSNNEQPFKTELRLLMDKDYPNLKKELGDHSEHWQADDQEKLKQILTETDNLYNHYKVTIMSQLTSFESYEDPNVKFLVTVPYEEIDEKVKRINYDLTALLTHKQQINNETTKRMFDSFSFLQISVIGLGIVLVIGGILISLLTVSSIVKPITKLKNMLYSMSLGILPKERMRQRSDEIGEMNFALNGLIESMEGTKEFAQQVGAGNFESDFRPLSAEDQLGHALLKMRVDLRENERVLEEKVIARTEEVVHQKEVIERKNVQLEFLYKQVTDSIKYAKRIQEAILPPDRLVQQLLPGSFVFYKPKDIVSGDFYFFDERDGKTFFAAVDCTGHGVPGAFMSIVGYNLLKDVVANTDINDSASIMDKMNEGVGKSLHHGVSEKETKDGMDMSMCIFDPNSMVLNYAGAFNPLYHVRNGEVIQYKADKFPVGLQYDPNVINKFTSHTIQLQKGDCIYVFSDGYADQFGGPRGKKFMNNNFRDLLLEVSKLTPEQQKVKLSSTIEQWRGNLEQVDDMLIIGLKV